MSHKVIGPIVLRDRPHVLAFVREKFDELVGAGVIARNRAPIDPGERVIYVPLEGIDGEPVAFIVFYEAEADLLWADLVYTLPHYRRRRMGFVLLRRLREIAVEEGFARIAFGTSPVNVPMQRLAASAGVFLDHHVYAARAGGVFFRDAADHVGSEIIREVGEHVAADVNGA
jgi:GNAT superfamily N-acetyltransferase